MEDWFIERMMKSFYSDRMILFTVPVDPLPQPRPKFSRGRVYQPRRIIDYKEQVQLAALQAMSGKKIFDSAVEVSLKLYRKFSATSRNFGDCDNLAKSICDALRGIVYVDDAQIVKITIEKFTDKANPRAEIAIKG